MRGPDLAHPGILDAQDVQLGTTSGKRILVDGCRFGGRWERLCARDMDDGLGDRPDLVRRANRRR